jgi:hypothetical protein
MAHYSVSLLPQQRVKQELEGLQNMTQKDVHIIRGKIDVIQRWNRYQYPSSFLHFDFTCRRLWKCRSLLVAEKNFAQKEEEYLRVMYILSTIVPIPAYLIVF